MKTVRIYFPTFPFPPTDGSAQVAAEQVRVLMELGLDVELVVWKESEATLLLKKEQAASTVYGDSARKVSVRLMPEGDGGAPETSSGRALRTARALFSGNASPELYYYPALPFASLPVRDFGIYNYSFAYSQLREEARSERRRAVCFHNLESDLFADRARHSGNPLVRALHRLNSDRLRKHEIELAGLADEVWFISPADQVEYQRRAPRAVSRLVPPTFAPAVAESRRARRHKASGPLRLGFIGGLDFGPNRESALWILDQLAPRLEVVGFDGEILIAGKGADSTLLAKAARFPFVKFVGFLPDAEDFWSSISVLIAPHLSGSGVRMKILEGLVSGVLTFTTCAGAERLDPSLRNHPLLWCNDDPTLWVKRISGVLPWAGASGEALPDALIGERVYGFMREGSER